MINAVKFGEKHHSCSESMVWLRSLPKRATQADAWKRCERGNWLLWQLANGLTSEQYDAIRPALKRATDRMAKRAILRAHLACVDAGIEIPDWEIWAFDAVTDPSAAWSAESAESAARSAESAAWSAELLAQAEDIRAEIQEWPGTEEN
jgi:hypothetical protein